LAVRSVQRLNTFEATGRNETTAGQALDDIILEHLTVQRELAKLDAREELVLRLLAEGYTNPEIGVELGLTVQTVVRLRRGLAVSLGRQAA
jgi:DNA-binding NarL/FixJ family response regulator